VIAMGGNELEVLEHYNRKIQRYGDRNDAAEILIKCLSKLDQVRVNISLLQDTGIGRTVSALKKRFGDHEIGTMSRDLVNKWKDVVSKEENLDEQNSEENEDEDVDENERDIHRSDQDPPAYIPTPIAPSYTPTPIDELPTIAVAETSDNCEVHENPIKIEKSSRSHKEGRGEEPDHHKSKKKKSHHEREREESKNVENIKNEKDSKEKRREKEKSHKHKHSEKEKESKHDKEKSSKDRTKDHKSSKSSQRDKSRDSESDRKSDKHRTKEKESRHKIKEEKVDDYEKVKSSISSSSSGYRSREEKHDSGIDIKHKIKKEPLENGFDFMKENDTHEKSKSKELQKKSKEKSRADGREGKSKSRELATVDIFAKSMHDSEEPSPRKRHREEEKDDFSKYKKQRSDSSQFILPAPPVSRTTLPSGPSLIPEISPVYKPLPRLPLQNMDKVLDERNTDEESLSILLSNKNRNRAAIYSGTKRKGFFGDVPSLFDQCIQVLKDHVDEIDEVGNLGYDILQPVLDRACPKTLMHIEDCNPYLMEETYQLWEKFVKNTFRNKEREDMESWREMYERCSIEREEKLEALKGKVKQCYKAEKNKHKETKLAYVDSAPKAPRSIRNAQAKNGTALPVGHSMVAGAPRPRNQLGDPTANASRAGVGLKKPRVAPMMAKTMKLMKGIKGGFRR